MKNLNDALLATLGWIDKETNGLSDKFDVCTIVKTVYYDRGSCGNCAFAKLVDGKHKCTHDIIDPIPVDFFCGLFKRMSDES